MIIVIDEYIDATNETRQRTIENVIDIQTTCNGPEGSISFTQTNGNKEEMDIGDDFTVTRFTDNGTPLNTESTPTPKETKWKKIED